MNSGKENLRHILQFCFHKSRYVSQMAKNVKGVYDPIAVTVANQANFFLVYVGSNRPEP